MNLFFIQETEHYKVATGSGIIIFLSNIHNTTMDALVVVTCEAI